MSYQKPHKYVEDFIDSILSELSSELRIAVRREVTTERTRLYADYAYGKVLIECESPGKRGDGRDQLLRYMKEFGYRLGLLIDIPTERYYHEYPKPYGGKVGFELYLDGNCIDMELFDRGELQEARNRIRSLLLVIHRLRIATLSPRPDVVLNKVRNLLSKWEGELLKIVGSGDKRIRAYFEVWRRGMELVYGRRVLESISGNLHKLFIDLTIYVTVLKVLGSTVLESVIGGGRYTIPMMLSREGSRAAIDLFWHRRMLTKFNINYLFERDEYDWVFEPETAWKLDQFFRDVGSEMLEIDWSQGIDLDLLKRVYQNIVPIEMRRQLGEYYTPDWIAKLMLWRSLHILVYGIPPKDILIRNIDSEIVELINTYYGKHKTIPRLIDPTCGSFTFGVQYLNALVSWYSTKRPGIHPVDFVRMILQNVVGIDLNPVAVITAKVNYLLQIYRLLTLRSEYLYEEPMIPIYRADLILLHELSRFRGRTTLDTFLIRGPRGLTIYIPLSSFGVPHEGVERLRRSGLNIVGDSGEYYVVLEIPRELFEGVRDLQKMHRALIALLTIGVRGFESELSGLGIDVVGWRRHIDYIVSVVRRLEELGIDYIWHSLFMNYILVMLVARDRFDIVIGNLPWVNVSTYPDGYRDKLKAIAKDLGIYPPAQAARKLDISIILFAISARYLLKGGGVIALMVPTSIFRGLHGAMWRDFDGMGLRILECFDLEDVKPFEGAENQPGIVFAIRVRT